jgi:hypothetical protein
MQIHVKYYYLNFPPVFPSLSYTNYIPNEKPKGVKPLYNKFRHLSINKEYRGYTNEEGFERNFHSLIRICKTKIKEGGRWMKRCSSAKGLAKK